MTAQILCDEYFAARAAYTAKKKELQELYDEARRLERKVIDGLIDSGLTSMKLENGVQISLRSRWDVRVNKANEYQVSQWLQETEGDVEQFSKKVLNKSAILNLLKGKIAKEELDETEIPSFFQLTTTPGLTVKGAGFVSLSDPTTDDE